MSGNEIEFGELAYREPRRMIRPDRDRSLAFLAYGTPQAADLAVFLDHAPADAIERHALSDTSVELGGILLGHECVDPETGEPFVRITQALAARHYENTQASFTYTHESWAEITRERDERFPDLDIVGWYHTHPDFGIFLSSHDLFIHNNFFEQPLQVAYVIDPIRQDRGFFQWRDGQVTPVTGFLLVADRAQRPALARFVHDLEDLPPGDNDTRDGLSPRLEAELIAMLRHSRTTAPPPPAATGLLAGMIGAILGCLLLATGLWLFQLSQSIRDQSTALAGMNRTIGEQLETPERARVDAKEAVLDSLLREIRVGDQRESVLAAYQRMASQRDQARTNLESMTTDKQALNALSTQLGTERDRVAAELNTARSEIAKLQQTQEETIETQRSRITELEERVRDQNRLIDDGETGALARRLQVAWYVAGAAIITTVLLALGLLWSVARGWVGGSEPPRAQSGTAEMA